MGQTGVGPRVRQEVVLQGCKLHLAGLPCRVASSTLQGCKLYLAGL